MESSEASSLAQGLRIVRVVADREKWGRPLYGVTQIAADLGLDRSRVSRLTQELCDLRLLERVERGPFRPGSAFFALAASLNTGWAHDSRAELQRIEASLGLPGKLSVLDGARVILVRSSAGHGALAGSIHPGMVTPVWCTGSGRALLWDHTAQGIAEVLDDVEFIGVGGPQAAHSAAEVAALMERDHPRGCVYAVEEFEHGVHEIAVPIRSPEGRIVASLCVYGGRDEFDGRLEEIRTGLEESARTLSAASSAQGPPSSSEA
ncbi:helix-turn-helix domain-containing protein [Arthrobacter sp. D1-29]